MTCLSRIARFPATRFSSLAIALATCATFAACGSGTPPLVLSGGSVGDVIDQPPDPTIQSKHFIVDPSSGGHGGDVKVTNMYWGRLVDVLDGNGVLQQKEFVVGEDIQSDNSDYVLSTNVVTSITTVKILHPYVTNPPAGEPPGGAAYHAAFVKLEQGLFPITPKGASPSDLPPWSLAPRNSAVVIRFDDLLDANTIRPGALRVVTGNPPTIPFPVRVIRDQNHGDLTDANGDGVLEFHTTRVIIAPVVTELDSTASNPPLPVNQIGLPPAFTVNQANAIVRMPTTPDPSTGQTLLLKNLTGKTLAFSGNGPNDGSSSTQDVVRAFRSGGTMDASNGFLLDVVPPTVVGVQPVGLSPPGPSDGVPNDGTNYRLTFSVPGCLSSVTPLKVGDVVRQLPTIFAEITGTADATNTDHVLLVSIGTSSDKKYTYAMLDGSTPGITALSVGQAELSTAFDPVSDVNHQACFVRFSNIGSPPASVVDPVSSVRVRYSEPLDPASVKPFDTQVVKRSNGAPTPTQIVVGTMTPSDDLREFTLVPSFPFAHAANQATPYFVNVGGALGGGAAQGPTDLAGNALAVPLPQVSFTIDQQAAVQNNGGVALRFNSLSEVNPTGNGPPTDIRGQFQIDITNGILRPRNVTHFSAAADRSQPLPSVMTAVAGGSQTPLSGLGSKLQQLWRYCDVGIQLMDSTLQNLDETFHNIDVQNIDWAPKFGSGLADHFSRFEIGLCHSFFLPDESFFTLPNGTMVLNYPLSGLVTTYSSNYLDPANDQLKIVHNRALGYIVNPSDLFASENGVPMIPYPLNRTIPVSQYQYYTWRDTALQMAAAPNGPGAELLKVVQVTQNGVTGLPFASGMVESVALPLLMEFRCFPDNAALGLNQLDVSVAVTFSSRPNFRAFSTGGVQGTTLVIKDPDLETVATGGFNPNSTPPGAPTLGVDNTFYIGQLDMVLRVSRAHTIWFDTGATGAQFAVPVVEPSDANQPTGAQIVLAFRGATAVSGTGNPPDYANATKIDPYGEIAVPPNIINFLNADNTWKPVMSQLNGARWVQGRVSFISNAQSGLAPVLSSLGFAYKF
jgi:hypothetical protein